MCRKRDEYGQHWFVCAVKLLYVYSSYTYRTVCIGVEEEHEWTEEVQWGTEFNTDTAVGKKLLVPVLRLLLIIN